MLLNCGSIAFSMTNFMQSGESFHRSFTVKKKNPKTQILNWPLSVQGFTILKAVSPSSECKGFFFIPFLLSSVPLLSYLLWVSYLCIFSHKILNSTLHSFPSQIEMIANSTLFLCPKKTNISGTIQSSGIIHGHHPKSVSEDDGFSVFQCVIHILVWDTAKGLSVSLHLWLSTTNCGHQNMQATF